MQLQKDGPEAVDRWAKENVFECDYLLIPVHEALHWVIVVVDMSTQHIMCYDPLDASNSKHAKCIMSFLERQAKINNIKVKKRWRVRHLPCDTPCKKDIESCGLVSLMYAKFLRVGMPLSSMFTADSWVPSLQGSHWSSC